ncbi:MAG: PHP domain-containing protein [Chloroflexi bacterium]|nr:MAG: PHP domain-containing protein [Chloroflexota bacterium]
MLADLHMHSTVSDGWKDPDEVAHLAADGGVQVMALSDHDSFYGVLRARRTAHGRGLGYVTAIEITTYPPLQFRHILGHGVDMQNPVLRSLIGRNQAVLRRQTEAWIAVLRERGWSRTLGLDAFAHKPMVMPGAVLKLVLQHGLMSEKDAWSSVREAVDFLPTEVYTPMPSPQEAIEAIHAAGGLAVHAHPGTVPDQELMKESLPLLDALEVYTRRHRPEQISVYEELARRHGLPTTVGTDFHGFKDEAYEAPRISLDPRYLDRLRPRIEWPALEATG